MNSKKIADKKGVSLWISWVLLMAFMIFLGAFMFNWMSGLAKDQASGLEKRSNERTDCDSIAVVIDAACQDTQSILVDVENTKNFRIDGVVVRLYDAFDNVESKEKNITVQPKETRRVEVVKQGAVRRVEVVPYFYVKDTIIYCRNGLGSYDAVKYC